MKKNILKTCLGAMAIAVGMASCTWDPDESNLYTATGETIEDIVAGDSTLTSFHYILQRVGYDRIMAAYGQYTCFAPSNEGVAHYIDSLYNDNEAIIPHNGMTANSLAGLSDSLCNELVRFHLHQGQLAAIDMSGDQQTVSTLLTGRTFSAKTDTTTGRWLGYTILADASHITESDLQAVNGLVHKITQVIPRVSQSLADIMLKLDEFSIFSQALQKTKLCDSLTKADKGRVWTFAVEPKSEAGSSKTNYYPKECLIKYTIFAETNDVLAANNIHSVDDLAAWANEAYENAPEWYDALAEKGLWNEDQQAYVKTVSTGTDYYNRNNALNMFVAYHILYAGMTQDRLVFEKPSNDPANAAQWHYCNGGEPYDYYETMLPQTIMKIWLPNNQGNRLYINRYRANNTLTKGDESKEFPLRNQGTLADHPIVDKGVEIERRDVEAGNGYIHPLKDMLVYHSNVPKGVLNERMRFDTSTILHELINNNIRYNLGTEYAEYGDPSRVAIPVDFCDNFISYTGDKMELRYNVRGAWRAWESDQIQGWGQYDFAIKLPPVPTGLYEIRAILPVLSYGSMYQFYIGPSTNVQRMEALGLPLDISIPATDGRVGWTPFYNEPDDGLASDAAMRTRGYMRAPYSYYGGTGRSSAEDTDTKDTYENGGTVTANQNLRGDGVVMLRRILGQKRLEQGETYWLRMKGLSDNTSLKWTLDFVEVVPVNTVVNNRTFIEDWY